MEQELNKNENQNSLPIKTKIAAWLVIANCGAITAFFILILPHAWAPGHENGVLLIEAFICMGILLLVSGIFILKKKKWAY